MKKKIIRDMTVREVSTVDRPAVKGATVAIMKSAGMDIRKNASDVVSGEAQPLYKAAEYGDAMMDRASEIAERTGTTVSKALSDHCGSDPVLIELAAAERAAEYDALSAQRDRLFAGRDG